jgi:hypothetical protein
LASLADGVTGSPDLTFGRTVIGVPLRMRTREMRAVRLSDEYTEEEIDEQRVVTEWVAPG